MTLDNFQDYYFGDNINPADLFFVETLRFSSLGG